ncbi:TonB-dependent siderophore receptor [Noviherbaspirillum sp. UKPF54]|uniref:TonB-dependent receptor plug domain-containing protein n=1 Tax=Noviherbaspirillum sp. UKPF54 TaxID=2601898 RepID=UPI0011B12E8D|nr:TonB-dependent receptor [Noviherbaspirillum sp. UKPF54]QDZ28834.1 TonB-dependent receptor [Noviherbaspirillum sp. UKPF54]
MPGKSARSGTLVPQEAVRCCALALGLLAWAPAGAVVADADLASLPMEQLLSLEVYSASKFVQKVSDAPSAVSVVTAADIRAFGWRTLADILRSMRGLYVNNDRNYSYLGARGFLRPGDYNTRFLLLVDGYRINDAVYDQAAIGTEFMLDVDLIERVEFVPGPGSSIYGSNAFFGVINIITRRGSDMSGARAAVEAGSYGARKARASYGWHDDDREFLISASSYRIDGQDLYFPEFDTPAQNNGVARRLDYDRAQNLFVKGAAGPFRISASHGERTKGIPTASFSQVFNDPRAHTVDTQSAVDANYTGALSDHAELSSRLYWGSSTYLGDYIYDYPPLTVNRDGAQARWWGGEAKLVSTHFARHKVVAGAEYQRDYRRDQYNFNVDPYKLNLDDHRDGTRAGVYLQDEIILRDDLLLNAGMRYDRHSTAGSAYNPRLALMYKLTPATTVKTVYGTAYRAPNAYELYYQLTGEGGQKANPALKAESIRTRELIVEQYLNADTRITASAFHNSVRDLISQTVDPADNLPVFRNVDQATARGLELELEKAWGGGAKLRTSYSWQQAQDDSSGATLVNSPRHLAKFNLSAPLPGAAWWAGAEAQYVGSRLTRQGSTGGYWLANLTLSSARLARGLDVSASVYNLFDRGYADPGSAEHAQDAIRQDGRSFRVKLCAAF